jgi:hypothetical protein
MGHRQEQNNNKKPESSVAGAREKIIIHIRSRPTACRSTRHEITKTRPTRIIVTVKVEVLRGVLILSEARIYVGTYGFQHQIGCL